MFRNAIMVGLVGLLAACASQTATSPDVSQTAIPTATPKPTAQPTPTLEPTPDAAAFGAAYAAMSTVLASVQCPGLAIIDAAPDDPAAWSQAMAIIGPGFTAAATTLRALKPPATVKADVEALLKAFDERAAAAETISTASSMDEINPILDTTFTTTGDTIGQSGDAIRTALGLPPRDAAPCD